MQSTLLSQIKRFCAVGFLGLALAATAQAKPDPNGAPDKFVQDAANEALDVLKSDAQLRSGDLNRVNQAVDQHILPYVNFEKTTRLAAGRYWRQASADQQQRLAQAFRGTLVRTYSGALTRVNQQTKIAMLPFRGDANAKDVVVSSTISQPNDQPVRVDYRLEKTAQGWKIYDINVEGIWLIENYRNQFAQQINQNGVDGLINALNQRNQ
ncbi:MAG: ABC transporter substrate-binding protein [Achromobacter sp.]